MIEPTVGRIVHVYNTSRVARRKGPFAAIITNVHDARCIDAAVFMPTGVEIHNVIPLVQPEDEEKTPGAKLFAIWMPYQKTKAYGSESGEEKAGVVEAGGESKTEKKGSLLSRLLS